MIIVQKSRDPIRKLFQWLKSALDPFPKILPLRKCAFYNDLSVVKHFFSNGHIKIASYTYTFP